MGVGAERSPDRPSPDLPLRVLIPSVFAPSLIYQIGSGALMAVLALGALHVGFSQALASALMGFFGLVGVVSAPLMGALIGRIGEKPAMLTAGALALTSLATSLVALHMPGSLMSQGTYGAGVVILSLAANVWSLARQAYIAESLPWQHRARGLATLGGMVRLGNLVGPGIGAGAVALFALPGAFWLQITTTAVAMALVVHFAAAAWMLWALPVAYRWLGMDTKGRPLAG